MGYANGDDMVRVDFFQPSGKWYDTIAIKWEGFSNIDIHTAFRHSLNKHFEDQPKYIDTIAVCLKPYHEHAHPVTLGFVSGCWTKRGVSV